MSIFKCKMCGGDIPAEQGAAFGTCDSCGTTSTLPKANEERLVNLFNRANHFRQLNEFDKAMATYENILNEDSNNAEAHWGVVLCRYGIEYVEDPKTHERVPTCHRTQFEVILTDADYLAALQNASDSYTKGLYEEEAKKINEIQKGILAISSHEEPYDVFICYKETTDGGTRTKDSTLAQDIYFQLTNDGYKVFFSRITLEDRLGQGYEPFIFNALNTAKVMLVIGTKKEYFEAVWVKNEWGRFLSLMKKDRSRLLIPCYRDMDAYDLPDELAHLQSQDMGKIGFIQDLLRGVSKVLNTEKLKAAEPVISMQATTDVGAAPLIRRAFLSIEDEDFNKASELLDQALNIEPENAKAYIGQLLVERKITNEEHLNDSRDDLGESTLYQRALRFADSDYKAVLMGYAEAIKKNRLLDEETTRKNQLLEKATKKSNVTMSLAEAVQILEGIRGFKNADELLEYCQKRQIAVYSQAEELFNSGKYEESSNLFVQLGNYRDAPSQANKINTLMKEIENKDLYSHAIKLQKNGKYVRAIELFKQLGKFQDAQTQIEYTNSLIKTEQERIRVAGLLIKQRNKKLLIGGILAGIAIIVFFWVTNVSIPRANVSREYNRAISLFNVGEYEAAINVFAELGNFRNTEERIARAEEAIAYNYTLARYNYALARYNNALAMMELGEYSEAIIIFAELGDFRDAQRMIIEAVEERRIKLEERRLLVQPYLFLISADGSRHSVGLRADGTVVAVGDNNGGQLNVSNWYNIVSVSARRFHTVGLRADGTAVAVGDNSNRQLVVSNWQNIIEVSTGMFHTVGLRRNGTIVVVGDNTRGQSNIDDWQNIIMVSAGNWHTVGLRDDGTVVATGYNSQGRLNVDRWYDIVEISAGNAHTVGLRANGTVVSTNINIHSQGWQDIVAISAGAGHTVGLKADGTVVAAGSNNYGQLNVSDWQDIIAISAGSNHTIGLRADGTVIAVGDNRFGQLNVTDWQLFN